MVEGFNETIVAISTAPGNGGVGIVRISGPDSAICQMIPRIFNKDELEVQRATLLPLYDESKNIIDRVIAIYFKAPRSYTGESVLEIQAHGGNALLAWIVEIVLKKGKDLKLRLAQPGEFTERAFLNGKIDLVQAEAVADLISAKSKSAIKAASRSLQGQFSKLINDLNDSLINLRIQVEAILDFPEEEIDFLQDYKIQDQLQELIEKNESILAVSKQGALLREGVKVALVGNTNVGKSSLLNQIAGDEIAIVTDVAGTTRDKVQVSVNIENLTFNLVDTAGIRETEDKVEKIGIQRAKDEILSADIVLKLVDLSNPESEMNPELNSSIEKVEGKVPVITVYNKSDLVEDKNLPDVPRGTSVFISAKTGQGLERLKKILIQNSGWNNNESVFIARERHLLNLKDSLSFLEGAKDKLQSQYPLELVAEDLREASNSLGDICGKTTSDDLLGKIFAGFCIGK